MRSEINVLFIEFGTYASTFHLDFKVEIMFFNGKVPII